MNKMRGIGAILMGLGIFGLFTAGNVDPGLNPAEAAGQGIGGIIFSLLCFGGGSYLAWKSRKKV